MAALKTNKLVVVDLEATCWEPYVPGKKSEIIEIGICVVDLKTCSIVESNGFYVRPQDFDISEYCTTLTGITKEILIQKGHYLSDVLNTIKKDYPLKSQAWASWGDYDRMQLQRECGDKNIEYPFSRCHINLKHIHAFLNGLSLGIGMDAALRGYNIELEGRHHSGKDDSFNTAKLALRLFKNV